MMFLGEPPKTRLPHQHHHPTGKSLWVPWLLPQKFVMAYVSVGLFYFIWEGAEINLFHLFMHS